jgi:hypothetical protein
MKSEGSNEFTWWTLPRLVPTQLMSIMILLAITVPPVIAVIIAQRFQAIHAPTVVATVIMTLGLLAVSTQESTRIPYGKSPEASMRAATINSLAQTAALTFGSTVLAYVGTDHFGSALIVGFAAIGFFWTTYFGRFLLSLVYLSRLNQLPMSLTRFLGETRYAGITTYDGPAYKFVHVILEDLVAAG